MVTDAVSRHRSGMLSMASFKQHIDGDATDSGKFLAADPDPSGEERSEASGYFGAELPPFADVKRLLAEEAMQRAGGNRTRAAEILGTSRQALIWQLRNKDSQPK